ncbi:MFS transporter [Dictyobacter alpinus]|uniref:MFS transporter n=1 Tax=Dictyobacter alpinus TaxID=2014873 RepID=A0A402BEW0_9CHLR|nr:MFS transporter [Dictyobacter alpinus]GCE29832.1 MFS transporter [Dictyobacter alpinus]
MITRRLGFPKIRGHEALVVAFLLDALGTGLYLPFSLLYFQKIAGLALPAIGVTLTLATVLTLPMNPITGTLVDRFGGKPLVVASQILQAIGFLGYLIVHSIPLFFGTTLLVAAGNRVFYASCTALIAEVADITERDRWYGFVGATQSVGTMAGGLLAGFIVTLGGDSGYRVLILANVFSFGLSAISLCWHKTSRKPRPDTETTRLGGYRAVLADRPFLVLIACNVVFALCPFLLSIGLPLYLTETLHTSNVVIGVLFAFGSLLTICIQTLVVRFFEAYRRTRALAVASLLWVIGCILFAIAPLLTHALLIPYIFGTFALYTLAGLIAGPITIALAVARSPLHLQGRYVAVHQFSWAIAAAIAPIMFTFFFAYGPAWPWVVLSGFALVTGVLVDRLESQLTVQAMCRHDMVSSKTNGNDA